MSINILELMRDVSAAFELHQLAFEVLSKDGEEEASVTAWFEMELAANGGLFTERPQ